MRGSKRRFLVLCPEWSLTSVLKQQLVSGCLPSQGSQGKVREFTLPLEKSGNVREFSGKSGNFSETKKYFFRNSKVKKKYQIFDIFQKYLILREKIPGQKFKKC